MKNPLHDWYACEMLLPILGPPIKYTKKIKKNTLVWRTWRMAKKLSKTWRGSKISKVEKLTIQFLTDEGLINKKNSIWNKNSKLDIKQLNWDFSGVDWIY